MAESRAASRAVAAALEGREPSTLDEPWNAVAAATPEEAEGEDGSLRLSELGSLRDSLRDELLMVNTPAAGLLFAAACP